MKKKQATIIDIAKALKLSPSTVSKALKNHPDFSSETKKLVTDLAKKLNYEPNIIAVNLRNQTTNTIGVIIPEIIHFFFSTIIAGIEEVAYQNGYHVMFCQSNESYEKEVLDIKALIDHRVDGILVSFSKETTNFDHFIKAKERNTPIVFFDRITKTIDASNVIVEDYQGARKATEHLLDQGCKRIAHLDLASTNNLNTSRERLNGYLDVLKEHHLTPEQEYDQDCGDSKEEGYKCTKILLQLPNPPDGIFANNDLVACGAIQAIKEAGLSIPQDVAIVGFSNWQISEMTEPKLSTISQPGMEMGRVAARLLIDEMRNKEKVTQYKTKILPTELIIRGSSLKK